MYNESKKLFICRERKISATKAVLHFIVGVQYELKIFGMSVKSFGIELPTIFRRDIPVDFWNKLFQLVASWLVACYLQLQEVLHLLDLSTVEFFQLISS